MVFQEVDSDGNGVLDWAEFEQMMHKGAEMSGRAPFKGSELRALFATTDKDGNGTIDFHEFIHLQQKAARGDFDHDSSSEAGSHVSSLTGSMGSSALLHGFEEETVHA